MHVVGEAKETEVILVAEDDSNDVFFLNLAFTRFGREHVSLRFTDDGQKTIDYLLAEGTFSDREAHPPPSLLLVDLEMPRFDGIQLLDWLNSHRDLVRFPVVVFTGAVSDAQYREAMRFDFVTAYFLKSDSFDHLPSMLGRLRASWLDRCSCA